MMIGERPTSATLAKVSIFSLSGLKPNDLVLGLDIFWACGLVR